MLEPIKVSVDVNVHLSEKTEQFILGLFSGKSVNNTKPAAPAATAAKPAAPAATAAKPTAPAATAAKPESKPANTASDNISIEDVREALSKKVATHRSEIKEKLTELGAPSVTKLDKSKYSNMLDFLNSLD
nr:MAG TPA: activated protein kinase C receptor [Bacteriophage sp.]